MPDTKQDESERETKTGAASYDDISITSPMQSDFKARGHLELHLTLTQPEPWKLVVPGLGTKLLRPVVVLFLRCATADQCFFQGPHGGAVT